MRANLDRIAVLLLLTTAIAAPQIALAQQADPNPNVTVQDRPRPEYDPIGLRAGSFFIYPQITLGGLYDDNVRATDDDEESDFAATVAPRVLVESNFSRHALSLDVGGDLAFYQDDQDLNYHDFYARSQGRLDITRDNIVSGSVGINRLHEDPASPDDEDAEELTEYWRGDLDLNYRRNFNRIYALVGTGVQRFDFEDAGDINEDDRDRNHYLLRLRGGYQISPRFGAFAQGTYDVRRYDQTPNDEGLNRDSEGFALRLGTDVDITSILFGELGFGYNYRQYDDNDLDSVDGLGFGGKLTWNVTPLTTIILNTSGEIQETTADFEGEEATANFQKLATIDITHELLRNVLLNANAGYIRDDFEGTGRSDDTLLLGAGISYLLNRNLSLDATYDFSTRNSDEDDEEYTRNIILVGITARL